MGFTVSSINYMTVSYTHLVHLVQTFAYADAGKIQQIRAQGQLIKEEYTENGIEVEAYVPKALYQKLQ